MDPIRVAVPLAEEAPAAEAAARAEVGGGEAAGAAAASLDSRESRDGGLDTPVAEVAHEDGMEVGDLPPAPCTPHSAEAM